MKTYITEQTEQRIRAIILDKDGNRAGRVEVDLENAPRSCQVITEDARGNLVDTSEAGLIPGGKRDLMFLWKAGMQSRNEYDGDWTETDTLGQESEPQEVQGISSGIELLARISLVDRHLDYDHKSIVSFIDRDGNTIGGMMVTASEDDNYMATVKASDGTILFTGSIDSMPNSDREWKRAFVNHFPVSQESEEIAPDLTVDDDTGELYGSLPENALAVANLEIDGQPSSHLGKVSYDNAIGVEWETAGILIRDDMDFSDVSIFYNHDEDVFEVFGWIPRCVDGRCYKSLFTSESIRLFTEYHDTIDIPLPDDVRQILVKDHGEYRISVEFDEEEACFTLELHVKMSNSDNYRRRFVVRECTMKEAVDVMIRNIRDGHDPEPGAHNIDSLIYVPTAHQVEQMLHNCWQESVVASASSDHYDYSDLIARCTEVRRFLEPKVMGTWMREAVRCFQFCAEVDDDAEARLGVENGKRWLVMLIERWINAGGNAPARYWRDDAARMAG